MISLDTHLLTFVILQSLFGNSEGDSVTQNHSIFVTEKEKALLFCQYETTSSAPGLFWYIQQENKSPELIYNKYSQDNKKRFNASNDESAKTFNLEIAAAGLSDSATYYCALKPTLCDSFQDAITAETNTVHAVEGNRVKMSCNYTTTANILSTYLHWYRQYPRSKPEFIILIHGGDDQEPSTGFTVTHEKENKSVHLEISSAEVTDSALYYCALQPTVTGNP
ncbi:hypothetical protein AGOR_G00240090 [Albula goreensis]|uniref:Ig-like domain-containing protein n=1 Tax=Albula goreensis TaxID=1534307 RepID=A0A8T3CDD9_9TELE|nr:hypothetical protein AGOR_G00240090 [Albula goreensis]